MTTSADLLETDWRSYAARACGTSHPQADVGAGQNAAILSHLEANGSISGPEALERYGCFRLAARIKDLRNAGHRIETKTVTLANGKRVARYELQNH